MVQTFSCGFYDKLKVFQMQQLFLTSDLAANDKERYEDSYCQGQPKLNLNFEAEIALFSDNTATHPPT